MKYIFVLKHLAFSGILLIILLVYIRLIERRTIFYPMKKIEFTPSDSGMKYEDIFFLTADGKKLNGWFVPSPLSDAVKPRATLLYCHGNGGNISHRIEIIKMFNQLNMNVFIFDYRGYGKSEGSPSEKGIYLDVLAAYDYLLKRGDTEKNKIVVYGESLGSAVAIELASRVNIAGIICFGGFTSAVAVANEIFPFLGVLITQKFISIPKIKKVSVPKLIIHSRQDEIVPFRHGEELFASANAPKEFLAIRGGHNDAVFVSYNEFKTGIESFIKKYLR